MSEKIPEGFIDIAEDLLEEADKICAQSSQFHYKSVDDIPKWDFEKFGYPHWVDQETINLIGARRKTKNEM